MKNSIAIFIIFSSFFLLRTLIVSAQTPPEFIIPYAAIVIDGSDSDWQGISPAISDPAW